MTDGRRFRTLNVLDDYNRQRLGVKIDFFLTASRVMQALTRLVDCHSYPAQLRTDNGPEFIIARLSEWWEKQDIILPWIQTRQADLKSLHRALQRLVSLRAA